MDSDLEREKLHRIMEKHELVYILDGFRGQVAADFENNVEKCGAEVRKAVDAQLVDDLRNPLDTSDRVIGYIALLYEMNNDQTIEEAINSRVSSYGE